MATDQLINKAQGDAIISGLTAIKNAINDQPVPTQVEDVVADAFDVGVSYVPGDYCIYENKLYICDTAHHGAWDGNDFTLTTVGAVLEGLNNGLTILDNIMFPTINNIDYKFVWLRFSQTSDSAKAIFLRGKVNGVAKNLVASEVYGAITFCCSASYNITHGWFLNSSNAWRSYIDSANTTVILVVLALVSSNVNLTSEL